MKEVKLKKKEKELSEVKRKLTLAQNSWIKAEGVRDKAKKLQVEAEGKVASLEMKLAKMHANVVKAKKTAEFIIDKLGDYRFLYSGMIFQPCQHLYPDLLDGILDEVEFSTYKDLDDHKATQEAAEKEDEGVCLERGASGRRLGQGCRSGG